MARTIQTNGPESITEVVTSGVGMTAGDLIYLRNGDYGAVPNAATSSASFPITDTAYGCATGKQGISKTFANMRGTSFFGNNFALLSNGNIVYVYFKRPDAGNPGNQAISFQIRDSADAVVVAETTVSQSSTYNGVYNSAVAVREFSGGGFIIIYRDSSSFLCAQAYNNSGVSQGTYRSGTAIATNNIKFQTAKTSTNTVALAYGNSSSNLAWMVFSNTATVVSGPTVPNVNTYAYYGVCHDIAVRSTDGFIMVMGSDGSTSTGFAWYLYNTSYTLVSSGAITAFSGDAYSPMSLGTLPNGRFVLVNNTNTLCGVAYFETSGSWTTFSLLPVNSFGNSITNVAVTGYTGNKFVLFFSTLGRSVPGAQAFDSTNNTAISSSILLPGNSYSSNAFGGNRVENGASNWKGYEIGGEIWFIDNSWSESSYAYNGFTGLSRLKFTTSTALFVADSVSSPVVGSGVALAGAYSRGTSTPSAASFFASSSGTLTASISASGSSLSGYPVPPVNLASLPGLSSIAANTGCYQVLQTPAGQYLVLIAQNSGLVPIVGVLLSSSGSYLSFYTFVSATGIVPSVPNTGFRAYWNHQNHLIIVSRNRTTPYNFDVNVFDTSFASLYSRSQVFASMQWDGGTYYDGFDMYPLPYDNMLVIAGNDSGGTGIRMQTYNYATNTVAYNNAWPTTSGNAYGVTSVVASPSGVVAIVYLYENAGWYNGIEIVAETAASTAATAYTSWNRTGITSSTNYTAQKCRGYVTGNGRILVTGGYTPNQSVTYIVSGSGSGTAWTLTSWYTNFTSGYDLASTAEGVMTYVMPTSNNANNTIRTTLIAPGPYPAQYGNTGLTGLASSINFNNSLWNESGGGLSLCGGTGRDFAGVIRDQGANVLFFFILRGIAFNASTNLTAGVTTSSATFALNPSSGYVLKGVALETVSAGNAGRILTQGSTQLNANYSASTTAQTFNFENKATSGTQGSIVGRNITLVRKDA